MGEFKDICVYGIGGVGGYFGCKLVLNAAGRNVYFVARGGHGNAIAKNGLLLRSGGTETICRPFMAVNSADAVPKIDILLLCVKGYGLEEAVKNIAGKIRPDTVMIPLLNGVDIYERIRGILKRGIVLPSCVYISSFIESPGVVSQTGGEGLIIAGKDPLHMDFDEKPVIDLFGACGIKFQWSEDARPAIWEKYMYVAPFALVTAYTGKPFARTAAEPGSRKLVLAIMDEISSIAAKKNITIKPGLAEELIARSTGLPPEAKTSYQRDVEKGGKNEGDIFGGAIIRMGKESGVPTPVTEEVYGKITGTKG
jgi:2-dehydropantoate 2-reductase